MQPNEAGNKFRLKLYLARFSGTYWKDNFPNEPAWIPVTQIAVILMPMVFHQLLSTWIECRTLRGTASQAWVEATSLFASKKRK